LVALTVAPVAGKPRTVTLTFTDGSNTVTVTDPPGSIWALAGALGAKFSGLAPVQFPL
jgi:hypothetical protein